MEKRREFLPRLKSANVPVIISPKVSSLIDRTGLAIESQTVVDLANKIIKDMNQGYQSLMEMDAKIGGVGQHNVNQEEGDMVTGAYRIEFGGIFRPIQYVYQFIGYNDLVWNSRWIVLNSCLHVEKAIKYRFNIPEKNGSSLGILLRNIGSQLDVALLDILKDLNKTIYRQSKHTIEHLDIDAHDYSPADAIGIYIVCRWAGYMILEPTGLFNDWQKKK